MSFTRDVPQPRMQMRPDCCPKRIRRQMVRPSHVEVYRESSGLSRKLCYSLMRSSNRGTMGITLQPSRQKLIIVQVMSGSEPVPFGWNLEIAEGATVDRYLPLSTNHTLWEQCINVWMETRSSLWNSSYRGDRVREIRSEELVLESKYCTGCLAYKERKEWRKLHRIASYRSSYPIFNKFYLLQHFSNFLISLKIVSRVSSFRLGCSRFARHTLYIQLYQLTETNFQLGGRNLSSRRRVKILGRPKKGGGEKKRKRKEKWRNKINKDSRPPCSNSTSCSAVSRSCCELWSCTPLFVSMYNDKKFGRGKARAR